jgi:lipopolysaccharide export system ATP-binding protein
MTSAMPARDDDPRRRSLPVPVAELLERLVKADRSAALALHAVVSTADATGVASFDDVARLYRDDYLHALRNDGRDVAQEAGRLSLDEVRQHLTASVLPRLAAEGIVSVGQAPSGSETGHAARLRVRVADRLWADIAAHRRAVEAALRETGEHPAAPVVRAGATAPPRREAAVSTLSADGLVKVYRQRHVVNDVALRLQQGEIVGLLGPNGAGKTTTFYMIVGLIAPNSGRIVLDGEDITSMPMFRRARRGIGYLSQEPSIFRKLSVEDNILAILETLDLTRDERDARLEELLDELSIKHLRKSKAFQLSGGERRRLEITRALVTRPKFMMLDEPFAGVDPIAVHDIQTIVAGLRHRGIGVLISDHNVEQTLDIVDRAYIMFDGQVKVSGSVRDLVFDDTVADIYLGPTLTARLRDRFAAADDPRVEGQ